ncbi:MAG: efflux RND transporter periplasmic adaptor subunit [Kiritimatiellae bacterium]|nr:efflux RND transporter periplasmic adaptor subunit [Kiritimatiellia bacterium]
MKPSLKTVRDSIWRFRWALGVAALGTALAVALTARRAAHGDAAADGPLHDVREGPLTISVVSAGSVQNQRSVVVRSEVEGRNTIIWIIDDGKSVTNGQMLLELDASTFADRRTDQQILVANAEAARTQSTEKLAIARNEREASVAEAELKLHLARLEQEKYNSGEYPQLLQESSSKIALANEETERARESLNWSRRLADEGYLTRSELQADELALKQKQSSLDAAVTALNVLTNFTARQQQATLASNLKQAEMALDRVTRQTRADVIQAESDLRARELEADRQRERLAKLEKQIAACRIVAPTNGVVIYASTVQASRRNWGSEPLQAGAQVVERQELIHIPVDDGMNVEMSVPESNLTKLREGQSAVVKVEALPGRVFKGRLSRIGLLPDGRNAWLNPDLKLYNCVVELESYDELRAGMNCEVELVVERYENVVSVPLQCVMTVGGKQAVYVYDGTRVVMRPIKLGLDNNRVVHVLEGLSPGERVLLNPPLDAGSVRGEIGESKVPTAAAPETKPAVKRVGAETGSREATRP